MIYPHINKKHVRGTALAIAKLTRAQKFTRVGEPFFTYVEGMTRAAIAERVRQQPSKGKTLT